MEEEESIIVMKYEQPMLTSFIMSATILWVAELIEISGKREVMTKHKTSICKENGE